MNGQTDNQQRKATELEIGWLCGVIDGEGTVSLRWSRNHPRTKLGLITPYVQIDNTHFPSLDKCSSILNMFQVGHHIQTPKFKPTNEYQAKKLRWRIVITGHKRVGKLLTLILPYLSMKAEQGECVFDFIRSRSSKVIGESYDEYELNCLSRVRKINSFKGKVLWNRSETTC